MVMVKGKVPTTFHARGMVVQDIVIEKMIYKGAKA